MLTPTTAASPNTVRRTGCTGIAAIFEAGTLAPCRAGEKIALHISTPQGEIIIRCSERAFITGCRGECDHNGVPFRSLEQIDVAKRRETDAAALPPPAVAAPKVVVSRRSLSPERLKLYEEIAVIAHGPRQRGDIAAACRTRSVRYSNWNTWHRNQLKPIV